MDKISGPMKNLGTGKRLLVLLLVFLLAWGMAYYYHSVLRPIRRQFSKQDGTASGNWSDFYPLWIAGRELLYYRHNPYSTQVTQEIQRGFYGRTIDPSKPHDPKNLQAFAYPVSALFPLIPFLLVSFSTARALFTVVLLVGTAASVPFWIRGLRLPMRRYSALLAVVATLSSFACIDGLHWTQMTLLTAALLASAMAALASERLIMAGVFLALATVKPQLTIAVVAFLACWTAGAWQSRKKLLFGFGAVVAALLLGSELVLPGWFGLWRQTAQRYLTYNKVSLLEALLGHKAAIPAAALASFFCLMVFWHTRRQPVGSDPFNFALVAALSLTSLILPNTGASLHYQIMLVPACLWLFVSGRTLANRHRMAQILWWTAVTVFTGEWFLALCVSLATVVLRIHFQREHQPFVFASELLTILFPLMLALFVLSVAPQSWRMVSKRPAQCS